MEFNATDPIDVAFSAHDEVTVGDRPELPGCIVTSCRNNVFLWVVAERSNSHQVPLERLAEGQMRAYSLEGLIKSWVVSLTSWNRSRLVCLILELCSRSRRSLCIRGSHRFC